VLRRRAAAILDQRSLPRGPTPGRAAGELDVHRDLGGLAIARSGASPRWAAAPGTPA